ncbi:hypothetical protein HMPREF1531_00267 [Propionibacterium sp. oral taxon 192 str. F0372]|nr:hypothetical protein HMPREF1531_00267 [Propionibacterium sp. oral taxon 192 str. F0372]
MSAIFSSLAVRNYRIYFSGALAANIGSWMGRTAVSWLVLVELTDNSASALGWVTAILFLPGLVLAPLTGSLADRLPKLRILMTTQMLYSLNWGLLSLLVLTGRIELWMVYAMTVVDGLVTAFDNPARQAFVSEIVDITDLPNAVGLNSTSFNTARLIGPGLAGVLIALTGTGWVLLLNSTTFVAMLIALASMRTGELHPAPVSRGRGKVREGLRYMRRRPDLLIVLACGVAVGGLGFNFTITNAVMATSLYGKGPGEYGILGSAMGLGALGAALWSAGRGTPRLRYVLGGMAGYVVFNFAAAISPSYELFAILQVPVGLAAITTLVTANTMLQAGTAEQMRGRVMALWSVATLGMTPLISPVVGWLGDNAGPRWTVLFGVIAVAVSLVTIYFYVTRHDKIRLRLDRRRRGWLRLDRS